MKPGSYEEILSRLKELFSAKSDADVARGLGVSTAALSSFKKQGKFPYERLVNYCLANRIDIEWLLTGEGEMKRQAATAAGKGTAYQVRDPLREEIIDVLDEIFIKEDRRLPPRKMEELIQLLYEELSEEESEEVRKGKVLRFVRALAA